MVKRHSKKVERKKLLVFASGRGSNFEAICRAVKSKKIKNTELLGLVCNVESAGCLKIAKKFKVPTYLIPHFGITRAEHEAKIWDQVSKLKFDLIVLAGYMRIMSSNFVEKFRDKKTGHTNIVNIHPSLLPSFPGLNAYEQAYKHGVKIAGSTVHLVGSGLDDGPIIAQESFRILENDSLNAIESRGLKIEHKLYVSSIDKILNRRVLEILGERK